MGKKVLYIVIAVLVVSIGLYPMLYFFVDRKFGLLSTKSAILLTNVVWNTAFYTHIIFGGIALLIGWLQFNESFRQKRVDLHRLIGKGYVIAVLVSATSGIYLGYFATGGVVAVTGFICLGLVWFFTTWIAYRSIVGGQIERHKQMMLYSYAACFAAVTLRLWLPMLIVLFGDFTRAYVIVAWLCWLPNMLVAFLWNMKRNVFLKE